MVLRGGIIATPAAGRKPADRLMPLDPAERTDRGHALAAVEAPVTSLAGLLLIGLVVGTVNGLSRVAMPLFAAVLGAQPWQVGMVGGLGYTGMLLLALPMGAWLERHGRRVLFMRGVAAAALLYFAISFARSPSQAILGAAALGLFLPFRIIPVHAEFLALLPRLSPSRAGWNRAAGTLGMFFLGGRVLQRLRAAVGGESLRHERAGRRRTGHRPGCVLRDHLVRSRVDPAPRTRGPVVPGRVRAAAGAGPAVGLGTAPAALWLGAAASGVGLGLQGLTSTTRFAAFLHRFGRGRIGGLASLGAPAGGVVGVMVGGAVSQRFGTPAGFLLLAAACALVCATQCLRLHRTRAR